MDKRSSTSSSGATTAAGVVPGIDFQAVHNITCMVRATSLKSGARLGMSLAWREISPPSSAAWAACAAPCCALSRPDALCSCKALAVGKGVQNIDWYLQPAGTEKARWSASRSCEDVKPRHSVESACGGTSAAAAPSSPGGAHAYGRRASWQSHRSEGSRRCRRCTASGPRSAICGASFSWQPAAEWSGERRGTFNFCKTTDGL